MEVGTSRACVKRHPKLRDDFYNQSTIGFNRTIGYGLRLRHHYTMNNPYFRAFCDLGISDFVCAPVGVSRTGARWAVPVRGGSGNTAETRGWPPAPLRVSGSGTGETAPARKRNDLHTWSQTHK